MILELVGYDSGPLCECSPGWALNAEQSAILDLVANQRYGADAATVIDGKSTTVVAAAAAQLRSDVQASQYAGTRAGGFVVKVCDVFVAVGTAAPTATWRAVG